MSHWAGLLLLMLATDIPCRPWPKIDPRGASLDVRYEAITDDWSRLDVRLVLTNTTAEPMYVTPLLGELAELQIYAVVGEKEARKEYRLYSRGQIAKPRHHMPDMDDLFPLKPRRSLARDLTLVLPEDLRNAREFQVCVWLYSSNMRLVDERAWAGTVAGHTMVRRCREAEAANGADCGEAVTGGWVGCPGGRPCSPSPRP